MSNDPSLSSQAQSSVRRWTIALKVCLALVIVPPLVGLVGTVVAMIRAFDTFGPPDDAADPSLMAEAIGDALMSTATGLMISLPALILLIISIIGRICAKRRLQAAG